MNSDVYTENRRLAAGHVRHERAKRVQARRRGVEQQAQITLARAWLLRELQGPATP